MATCLATVTTIIRGAPTQSVEAPAPRAYRLRESLAAVRFDPSGKGRIVFLPQGAELHLIGDSRLPECFEVMHGTQLYHVFQVDLLGPRSTPIQHKTLKVAAYA
jgi:hypothetical protein